jgi:hypothetical protein
MRRSIPLALAALTLLLLAQPVQAQVDMTGTWEITTVTQRGERTMTFTFEQNESALTGHTEFAPMGRPGGAGAGGAPREIPISNGKVEGNQVTFQIVMGMGQRSMTQTFTGTLLEDGTMEGTMTGGMGPQGQAGPVPFTGKRKTD